MPAVINEVSFRPFHLRSTRSMLQIQADIHKFKRMRAFYTTYVESLTGLLEFLPLTPPANVMLADLPTPALTLAQRTSCFPDMLTDEDEPYYSATMYSYLRESVAAQLVGTRSDLTTNTNNLRRVLEEELENSANANIVLKRSELQKALKPLANWIPQRSIRFSNDSNGTPQLSWQFHNLVMRPQVNHYAAINLCAPTAIPLKPFGLSLKLCRDGGTLVKRIRGIQYPTLYVANSAHPHMMRNGTFCLGDLNGPLEEIRMQHDFVTYIMMLKTFCETCNPDDPAGSSWWRYTPEMLRPFFTFSHTVRVPLNARGYVNSSFNINWYGEDLQRRYCEFVTAERDGRQIFVQVVLNDNDKLTVTPFKDQWRTDRYGHAVPEIREFLEQHPANPLATEAELDVVSARLAALWESTDRSIYNTPVDWSAATASPAAIIEPPPTPAAPQIRVIGEVQSLEEAYAA
jgi:hypothetical protein